VPADDPTNDAAFVALIDEADHQHEQKAYHLEAEALEKALGMLPPMHHRRALVAKRLAALYRGSLWRPERAQFWVQTIADELRPTPAGIDALFDLGETLLDHGEMDEALKIYREVLKRIVPPEPPYDRDNRAWKGWHGEELCKFPMGSEPLFPSDLASSGKLARLPQLVASRDWRSIRSILDQNLSLQAPIQQSGASAAWISLRRWVRETLSGLPAETVQALTASYDPVLAELGARDDWRAIAAFRFTHPIPRLEERIDALLGDRLLDFGLPGLASLHYGRAAGSAGPVSPDLLARELFSRIEAGESIAPDTVADVSVQVAGEKKSLREWVASWQQGRSAASPAVTAPLNLASAVLTRLPVVRATLPLRVWQLRWQARNVIEDDVPPFAEEFVSTIPVGSSRCLVVNMGDAIQAMDVVEGRTLWTFVPPEQNAMTFPCQKYEAKTAQIECARARTAVVAGDKVFCHLAWGHHDTHRHAGALFALDRLDGRMIWSSLQVPELADTMIAGDPAVDHGVVVAVAWRPREALPLFFVVGLSAETGELLWLNHLYSGASLTSYENQYQFDRPLASPAPVISNGVAYLCMGAGVVAALDIVDGTTVWAATYPRIKALNSAKWASHLNTSRPAGIAAAFKDTILFAPGDANVLLAIDRATGQTRYTQELLDLKAIAAADSERAYLAEGTTIRAVKPVDGQTLWQRPLPVSGLVGLPTLGARGLMCPSWEALYLLDPASGEIREQKRWSRSDACSYVRDLGDRLAGASRTGLNVLAAEKLNDISPALLSPETATQPVEVKVPSRADKWLRWGLPAVDRGSFVLSDSDPDHLLISAELLQMRDMEPVPTLRWQRLSPLPWENEATFNPNWVAVWTLADVYVMDAVTGRTAWEDHPLSRMGRPIAGVRLVDRQVQVYLGWKDGKVLSQTAPTFIVFDEQGVREVARDDASLLKSKVVAKDDASQGVKYEFADRRIRAISKPESRQLWQSTTLLDEPTLLTEMAGQVLALTQDRMFIEQHERSTSRIRILDKSTGEQLKDIVFPKRWFHKVEERGGRLLLWDCAFLYCIKPPASAASGESTVTIRQDRPDPDAVAALRMARDLEDPPRQVIATLSAAPRVDGDLAEWTGVEPRRLGGVMDWTPDFAHRSADKKRSYGGPDDCSAEVRLAFFGEDLYVAVAVSDDVQEASSAPGLWRSDSVSLLFGEAYGEKREEIDPLFLTVALVDGQPKFELGTAVSTMAVSDPPGQGLADGPEPRRLVLPAMNTGTIVLPKPTESIEVAALRDEVGRRTFYEVRVPKVLFRYGPGFSWDLFVNDNDGKGREGALQMASATWGTEETQIGSLRGVGERPQDRKPQPKRKRGGSVTRPAN
jgi:outer membrane protein assembly factor BamB